MAKIPLNKTSMEVKVKREIKRNNSNR